VQLNCASDLTPRHNGKMQCKKIKFKSSLASGYSCSSTLHWGAQYSGGNRSIQNIENTKILVPTNFRIRKISTKKHITQNWPKNTLNQG